MHEDEDSLILEGIVTSCDAEGVVNISPMGPRVDRMLNHLVLRPFQSSKTYQNLKQVGGGVFHVTDDVELLARCAISRPVAKTIKCERSNYTRLVDCCRWYAFEVVRLDDTESRTTITCEIVESGRVRDFFGLNRAKSAVVEAAILATRVGLLESALIREEFSRLQPLITKTAGVQERTGFEILKRYIESALASETDTAQTEPGV